MCTKFQLFCSFIRFIKTKKKKYFKENQMSGLWHIFTLLCGVGLRVSKPTGHILTCWVSPFSSSLWLAWSHTSPLLLSLVLWNLLLDVKKCYTAALRHSATSCFLFCAVTFRAFVSPKGGCGQSGNRKVKYGYGDGQYHSLWASFGLSRNLWVSFVGSHTLRDCTRLDAAVV